MVNYNWVLDIISVLGNCHCELMLQLFSVYTFLSPHADRHAGYILFTVCSLFVCRILVTDISGAGW